MYYLPTTIIFITYSILTLIYSLKNRHIKKKNHIFINEILLAALFLVAGVLFPFLYQFHSHDLSRNTLNYMWLFTSTILILEFGNMDRYARLQWKNFKKKS